MTHPHSGPVTFGGGFAQGFTSAFSAASEAGSRRKRNQLLEDEIGRRRDADKTKAGRQFVTDRLKAIKATGDLLSQLRGTDAAAEGSAVRAALDGQVDLLRQGLEGIGENPGIADRAGALALAQLDVPLPAPEGFQRADTGLTVIPGGPQDPELLEQQTEARAAGTAAGTPEVPLSRIAGEAEARARGTAAGTPAGRTTDLVDFSSGTAVLKTEASSSVRGAVATLFGGTFDPITQTIKGLDKNASRRALAVQAEAERLLLEQTEVTPAAAVQSALKTIEAQGSGEDISLPTPAEVQAMDLEKVRQLVESLPDDTEISPALKAAILKKLSGEQ